jgi:hypothetical protein
MVTAGALPLSGDTGISEIGRLALAGEPAAGPVEGGESVDEGLLGRFVDRCLAFVDPSVGRVRAAWNPGRGVTATPTRFVSARGGNRLYVLTTLGTLYALQLVGSGG